MEQRISALNEHLDAGERLAISLAQTAENSRMLDLEKELAVARDEANAINRDIERRHETGELAGRILEALRESGSDVVATRVETLEPLLQRIYARVDPHPAFRAVRLLTRVSRGRGRVLTELDDAKEQLSTESPEAILSSSQMNALAVSIFLALSLGVATPLQTAILDDPLQSLDDVNLLGLIDLLRRTKDQRQLLISTHDVRFGKLLELKLRPVEKHHRTRVIELGAWTRSGPRVDQRDVPKDLEALRLAV